MKFTLRDGYDFNRGVVKGHAYLTSNDFTRMSAAIFWCDGKTIKMKSTNSDRLYIVIKGKGLFKIGKNEVQVENMDVFIVPKNTWYSYEGTMQCFLVHAPAFDKTKEITKK
jgi:mannose-6-phosphate isomerase-like protein (cupin superfamily)